MRIGRVLLPLLALSSLPAAPASRDTKTFPPLYNTERNPVAAPMPPADAAAGFKLPPGFKATVFAAEPDVQNPIALAWDGRGRLWVAENFTYAESPRKFDLGLRDRVLIFEDRDGDGRFDSRTVFTENVQMLSSLELGSGGVWLMCPPRLLFMPDRDRNDIPDARAGGGARRLSHLRRKPPYLRQRVALGTRWLALRPLRRLERRPRRRARHSRGGAGSRARWALAVPSAHQGIRNAHSRHDQPVGPRLGRPWRAVFHQHRHRAPLACHPRRALHPLGTPSIRIRASTLCSTSTAITITSTPARVCATRPPRMASAAVMCTSG